MLAVKKILVLSLLSVFLPLSAATAEWVEIDKWVANDEIDYDDCDYRLKFGALFQGRTDVQSVLYIPATIAQASIAPGFNSPRFLSFHIPSSLISQWHDVSEQLPHPDSNENGQAIWRRMLTGEPSDSGEIAVFQDGLITRGVDDRGYADFRINFTYVSYETVDGNLTVRRQGSNRIIDANWKSERSNISLEENCSRRKDLVGDANRDGKVDAADVAIVYGNVQIFNPETDYGFGGTSFFNKTWEEGDFDGDGDVDYNDLYRTFIAYLDAYYE